MKTLHPCHTGREPHPDEPEWPAVPWECPRCELLFPTPHFMVATNDGDGWSFLCVGCDLIVFSEKRCQS